MLKLIITGKFLFVILLINFLFRIGMVLKPIESLDTYIPDDSFLSLKISKNIAEGKGPIYGDSYTNGFQPLFVFMIVPAYWLFPNDLIIPLKISLIMNSIFDVLTLLLILKINLNLTRSYYALAYASLVWIFNAYIISTSMNGLETVVSTFFLILLVYYIIKYSILESSKIIPQHYFIFGLLSGLATFARIDNAILSFIIYLAIAFNLIFKQNDYCQFVKSSLLILAGFLAVYSPWMIYSYSYTGLIYPISGKAVRFQTTYHISDLMFNFGFYAGIFKQSFKVVLINNLALFVSFVFSVIIISIKGNLKQIVNMIFGNKVFLILTLFCLTLLVSYSIYVPATWFFPRYFFPFTSVLVLITSVLIGNSQSFLQRSVIISIFAIFIIIESIDFHNKGIFYENSANESGYIEIGKWAETAFPDSTIIGSSQTGALGYFAENLKVINLDGVVNEACYKSLVNKKNMDYIRFKKIQYILGWDINLMFIRNNSTNFKENYLIKLGNVPKIKSWGNSWNIYKVNYLND